MAVAQVQHDADVFGALADATGHQDYSRLAKTALAKGAQGAVDNSDVVAEMRANRRINKQASANSPMAVASAQVASASSPSLPLAPVTRSSTGDRTTFPTT